jgi:hypothetical protein
LIPRLLWELRYQRDGWVVQRQLECEQSLPDWYLDEPELDLVGSFLMRAFWDLSTERSQLGPIPWSKIVAYASLNGLEAGMIEPFKVVMRALDNAYLHHQEQELAKTVQREKMKKQDG